jgi:hypothetical protein
LSGPAWIRPCRWGISRLHKKSSAPGGGGPEDMLRLPQVRRWVSAGVWVALFREGGLQVDTFTAERYSPHQMRHSFKVQQGYSCKRTFLYWRRCVAGK